MTTCKACGYTRRPQDVAPDYECPKCGRVYAKIEEHYQSLAKRLATHGELPNRNLAESAPQQPKQNRLNVIIALVVIVLAVGYLGAGLIDKWQEKREAEQIALERQAEAQRLQADRVAERERQAREQAEREADPAYIAQRDRQRRAQELAREREALEARRLQERSDNFQSIARIHNVATRWDELVRVAEVTPRIALAGPVQQMQAIRREAVALPVSSCVQRAKTELVRAMDFRITQFLEFMRNHQATQSSAIRGYEAALSNMQRALNECI